MVTSSQSQTRQGPPPSRQACWEHSWMGVKRRQFGDNQGAEPRVGTRWGCGEGAALPGCCPPASHEHLTSPGGRLRLSTGIAAWLSPCPLWGQRHRPTLQTPMSPQAIQCINWPSSHEPTVNGHTSHLLTCAHTPRHVLTPTPAHTHADTCSQTLTTGLQGVTSQLAPGRASPPRDRNVRSDLSPLPATCSILQPLATCRGWSLKVPSDPRWETQGLMCRAWCW